MKTEREAGPASSIDTLEVGERAGFVIASLLDGDDQWPAKPNDSRDDLNSFRRTVREVEPVVTRAQLGNVAARWHRAPWRSSLSNVLDRVIAQLKGCLSGTAPIVSLASSTLPRVTSTQTSSKASVAAIRAALPEGARVGTVDKFQGQHSPVGTVLHGNVEPGGCTPGYAVPLQPEPPQCSNVAGEVRGRRRGQPRAVHARVQDPGADAVGQRLLPIPGTGDRRRAARLSRVQWY
jgi:hypothetical protein